MKRNLLFGASFLFIAWAATSCLDLKDCKVCKQVFYLNNKVDHEGSETEYCGDDLAGIELKGPVNVGSFVAKWECR